MRVMSIKEPDEIFIVTPEELSIELLALNDQYSVNELSNKPSIYKQLWNSVFSVSQSDSTKPPILFIHGSYHSAWCWAEHFFDYFSNLGHRCYSISLRGTSGTGMPPNDPGESVRIEEHVSDIRCVLAAILDQNPNRPNPIIISHSFGGLITMKLLEIEEIRTALSAVVFLCSVPPSGNGPMTLRFIQSRFVAAIKIVYGFVLKAATTDINICRELFFDNSVPSDSIRRFVFLSKPSISCLSVP